MIGGGLETKKDFSDAMPDDHVTQFWIRPTIKCVHHNYNERQK